MDPVAHQPGKAEPEEDVSTIVAREILVRADTDDGRDRKRQNI